MKRSFRIIPLLAFCFGMLAGCSSHSLEPVSFYYCRNPETYQYFQEDGVITAESRDLSGHTNDLRYLVALYLAGPLEEGLVSPFPRSARLVEAKTISSSVQIELSDLGNTMTDSEFSLAAACLSKTCMQHFGASSVTIKSGARTITMNEANIILFDTAIPETTEGG